MSTTYRAAIIGCGRIGADCGDARAGSSRIASHAAAYAASNRTTLVAGCDQDPECLRRFGARWGVTALYSDPVALLANEDVDLVSICTPAATHFPLLGAALDTTRVRGVLLEKPIAESLAAADGALGLASRSPAKVAVNYIRRFPPVYRQTRDDIRRGALGRIQHVSIIYTKGLLNNGTHALDLLRFFFGDPLEITALSPSAGAPDPTLTVRVRLRDGVDAWLFGVKAQALNIFEVDILGSDRRVVFADQGHVLEEYAVVDTRDRHGFRQLDTHVARRSTDLCDAIHHGVEDLVGSIETGADPACTLQDGRAALELALSAIEGAP